VISATTRVMGEGGRREGTVTGIFAAIKVAGDPCSGSRPREGHTAFVKKRSGVVLWQKPVGEKHSKPHNLDVQKRGGGRQKNTNAKGGVKKNPLPLGP